MVEGEMECFESKAILVSPILLAALQ